MKVAHPFLWLCALIISFLASNIMWNSDLSLQSRLTAFFLGLGFIGVVVFSISRLDELDEEAWRRKSFG